MNRLEAQVTARYHRADRFHRFLEVDQDRLAPQDILFAFYELEPNLPRFPAESMRRDPTADA